MLEPAKGPSVTALAYLVHQWMSPTLYLKGAVLGVGFKNVHVHVFNIIFFQSFWVSSPGQGNMPFAALHCETWSVGVGTAGVQCLGILPHMALLLAMPLWVLWNGISRILSFCMLLILLIAGILWYDSLPGSTSELVDVKVWGAKPQATICMGQFTRYSSSCGWMETHETNLEDMWAILEQER